MKVLRVALSGYNAMTDTNPDHFSLYTDQTNDFILIKEKAKATVSVSGTTNIAHSLGYVPHCIVFAEFTTGVWRKLFSVPISGFGMWYEVNNTNLVLRNTSGGSKNFAYHIFYDNIT